MASKHPIHKWSIPQLQKHIRNESQDTAKVVFTDHALAQMKKRTITQFMALETLRNGKINIPPEIDFGSDLKCRMEYSVTGKEIMVVVALNDDDPNLVLITAI